MKKKSASQTVTIKSDEQNPVPYVLIAESIIKISDAFDEINKSQLDRRVIELLLKDRLPHIKIGDIKDILNMVPRLKNHYTKLKK